MATTIQSSCEAALLLLESIAKTNQIPLNTGGRLDYAATRELAELLRICPNEDGAILIMKKRASEVSGFIFLAGEIVNYLSTGGLKHIESVPDDSVSPFFYLCDGVISAIGRFEKPES